MSTKTTYIATAPDGSEIERKTARTYAYAVLVEVERRDGSVRWGGLTFTSREDLAVRALKAEKLYEQRAEWVRRGGIEERQIGSTVVPVVAK